MDIVGQVFFFGLKLVMGKNCLDIGLEMKFGEWGGMVDVRCQVCGCVVEVNKVKSNFGGGRRVLAEVHIFVHIFVSVPHFIVIYMLYCYCEYHFSYLSLFNFSLFFLHTTTSSST